MDEQVQKVEKLESLVKRVGKAIENSGDIPGFERKEMDECNVTLGRLRELVQLAREADLRQEYLSTLHNIEKEDLPLGAHLIIQLTVDRQKPQLKFLKHKLSELEKIETTWAQKAAIISMGRIAKDCGATNAKYVALLTLQEVERLIVQYDGSLVIVFEDDEEEIWWVTDREVPRCVEKTVRKLVKDEDHQERERPV